MQKLNCLAFLFYLQLKTMNCVFLNLACLNGIIRHLIGDYGIHCIVQWTDHQTKVVLRTEKKDRSTSVELRNLTIVFNQADSSTVRLAAVATPSMADACVFCRLDFEVWKPTMSFLRSPWAREHRTSWFNHQKVIGDGPKNIRKPHSENSKQFSLHIDGV